MSAMIRARDLHKSYGNLKAVDGVSLDIQKGEIYGLLGPNGAGKSTTIGMLTGYLRPDSGEVAIGAGGTGGTSRTDKSNPSNSSDTSHQSQTSDGSSDPADPKTRSLIGVAPQALAIYEELTGEENLAFCASLYGLGGPKLKVRVDWALGLAGLEDRRKDAVAKYSGGMKRRLNLACALVHDPPVLFLDEPTVGVDPQSRNYIFEAVEKLKKEGLTVLYTTHYMEEAQRLCDRVGIMDHGKILAEGTVDELIDKHGGGSLVVAEFDHVPESFAYAGGDLDDTTLRINTGKPFEEVAKLAQLQLPMTHLSVERPDLESVFLKLTGRSLRD